LTLSKQSKKNRIDERNSMNTTRPSVAGLVFAGLLASMAGILAPAQGFPSSQSGPPTGVTSGASSGPAASGASSPAVVGQPGAPGLPTPVPVGPTPGSFQESAPQGGLIGKTIGLSLDDAIQRGLQANLGLILSGTQSASARAQRLSELQSLLPGIDFAAKEAVQQVNLAAEGLRLPGFPEVIGPFGYTDLRAYLSWSVVDLSSLHNYLAARHNFNSAQLSAQDARDMVVLTVGNAYLLVLADQGRVASSEAQVATAKVSLDQAVARHQAGTAPLLDELRARVDYQSLQQQLIAARNSLEKDKLALARTIGLPVAQPFTLTEQAPYAVFDQIDLDDLLKQAQDNRKDLAAMVEQTAAAQEQRKAAAAERLPAIGIATDYGVIGTTLSHSHGTVDATGSLSVPVFREYGLRGEAEQAQAQLDSARAQLSDKRAQIEADVRDALLDIEAAQKQVEVARSSMDLAREALREAQERYVNGVSDNLAVSQAQQSVAQADDQYVASLYRDNVAKLSLARALGAAQDYRKYLGQNP
jgi:outer membrane protein TolC